MRGNNLLFHHLTILPFVIDGYLVHIIFQKNFLLQLRHRGYQITPRGPNPSTLFVDFGGGGEWELPYERVILEVVGVLLLMLLQQLDLLPLIS